MGPTAAPPTETQTPPPAPASAPAPVEPPTPTPDSSPTPPAGNPTSVGKKAYGGRSKIKWILIYVVIAVVVYAIAYVAYKHFHNSGTASSNSGLY